MKNIEGDDLLKENSTALNIPLANLRSELFNLETAPHLWLTLSFGFISAIRGDYWFAAILFSLPLWHLVGVVKRLQVKCLHVKGGELTFESVGGNKKLDVAGCRLTQIFNRKFTLLLPDGREEEFPFPSEWIDGMPVGHQFLQTLQKSGCKVDLPGWDSVHKRKEQSELVHVCEELTVSRDWYEGTGAEIEASLKDRTKFAAIQTITMDKGRISLTRRGYKIFDFALTDIRVELLYGVDKKKRGHTRICLTGANGEQHFLSDWRKCSSFGGPVPQELLNNLVNRGIRILRDPFSVVEFESSLRLQKEGPGNV